MAGYYDEILDEINELIAHNENEDALFLIEKELRMPYVPADFEAKILNLKRELTAKKNEEKEAGEIPLETLLKLLRGDEMSQLKAASALGERNLRQIIPEIRHYLSHDPCPEAAALIIEAIAEQEINEDFTYVNDGVTAEFFGDSVIPCSESGGFREALRLLEQWVGNDNPSMFAMCKTLLIRRVYMFLPLSYEASEGSDLALDILEEVSGLMDEGETYRDVLKANGLSPLLQMKS